METGYLHVSVFSMRFRRGLPWRKHHPNKYTLRNVQKFVEIFTATKVLVINKDIRGLRRESADCGFLERAT
jgi:hypothetical protein